MVFYEILKMKARIQFEKYYGIGAMRVGCNDTMKIYYYINDQRYCVVVPVVKGPRYIKNIEAQVCEPLSSCTFDIDSYIYECAGPYRTFHGIPTTPKMLGIDSNVTVTYRDDSKVTYKPNEIINIEIKKQNLVINEVSDSFSSKKTPRRYTRDQWNDVKRERDITDIIINEIVADTLPKTTTESLVENNRSFLLDEDNIEHMPKYIAVGNQRYAQL